MYLCNDLLPHLEITYKSIDDVLTSVRLINEFEFVQEPPAQIQTNAQYSEKESVSVSVGLQSLIGQEPPAQFVINLG